MKLISIIAFLAIIKCPIYSQQGIVNFGMTNQNTICSDGYLDNAGNSIILMYNEESGFMIGSFDSYLNQNWIKSFGVGSGTAGKMIKLSNGDFFGYILQDPTGHSHVFKFNSQGTIYWHQVFVNISDVVDCIELSNNNIAIVAYYGAECIATVFDPNGSVQFTKTFSDGHYDQTINDIIRTNDGYNLLIGGCYHPSHPQRIILSKIDTDFNQIWTKAFEYSGIVNDIRNAIQDGSNNYYLVGESADTSSHEFNDYDLSILKFDSLGNYLMGKSYGTQFHDEANDIEVRGLSKSINGNMIIIGNTKPVEICGTNLLVVSIDESLDTIFTKHYGKSFGAGTSYTELHSIGDSLYTFGSYSLWSNIGASDGHLIKTDNSFDLECEYLKNGMERSSNLQLTEISNPFVFNPTSISLNNYQTISTSNIMVKDACSGITLGEKEIEELNFSIYPNPTNNVIFITSEFNIDELKIMDLFGKNLLDIDCDDSKQTKVDLSEWAEGSYIVEIHMASKIARKKIILE